MCVESADRLGMTLTDFVCSGARIAWLAHPHAGFSDVFFNSHVLHLHRTYSSTIIIPSRHGPLPSRHHQPCCPNCVPSGARPSHRAPATLHRRQQPHPQPRLPCGSPTSRVTSPSMTTGPSRLSASARDSVVSSAPSGAQTFPMAF
jgi:hypothetical protein